MVRYPSTPWSHRYVSHSTRARERANNEPSAYSPLIVMLRLSSPPNIPAAASILMGPWGSPHVTAPLFLFRYFCISRGWGLVVQSPFCRVISLPHWNLRQSEFWFLFGFSYSFCLALFEFSIYPLFYIFSFKWSNLIYSLTIYTNISNYSEQMPRNIEINTLVKVMVVNWLIHMVHK